jgi:threonine dehydrogenase-like Zn-dependent dehydrogenase
MDLSRDVVFGHEFCCEVLDYGPGTTQKFKPGTKVCSLPALLTAEGPQGIGYSNDNIGAYAERMLLSEALLLEVPNGLAAEHAALTEPLAVGVHAVAKANIKGGEVPLVIGCGPVGLAVIAALKIRGLHPIVAADYSPARRALAEKLGADVVVDPARTQPYVTWAEHARMSPEEKAARPPLQALLPALKPALIFECVGVPGLSNRCSKARRAMRASSWSASAWKPTAPSRCSASSRSSMFSTCWATRRRNSRIPCA